MYDKQDDSQQFRIKINHELFERALLTYGQLRGAEYAAVFRLFSTNVLQHVVATRSMSMWPDCLWVAATRASGLAEVQPAGLLLNFSTLKVHFWSDEIGRLSPLTSDTTCWRCGASPSDNPHEVSDLAENQVVPFEMRAAAEDGFSDDAVGGC